jgi:hypothetical protein
MDPTTTKDDLVRTALEMRDLGFTAAYVYAHDITEPASVIDLLASALPDLARPCPIWLPAVLTPPQLHPFPRDHAGCRSHSRDCPAADVKQPPHRASAPGGWETRAAGPVMNPMS